MLCCVFSAKLAEFVYFKSSMLREVGSYHFPHILIENILFVIQALFFFNHYKN